MSDEKGIRDAALTAAMATVDPLEVASQNAELRTSIRGAYGLLRALVLRQGGSVEVSVREATEGDGMLNIVTENDVIRLSVGSRQQRRAGRKHRV